MSATAISTPEIYTDIQGLQNLKRAAREDASGATREVAQQFESLFVKMMLKSMRNANFGDKIFGSDQMDSYQDMYDNQMAMELSNGKGIGLADIIVRQLGGATKNENKSQNGDTENKVKQEYTLSPEDRKSIISRSILQSVASLKATAAVLNKQEIDKIPEVDIEVKVNVEKIKNTFSTPAEFVKTLWPMAKKVSKESGISPHILIAQAALETGWGKAISTHADGKSSFNLFNIKADHRWDGDLVAKNTLEYKDGITEKQRATFRAYGSFEESFQDFITYISNEPRYKSAMDVVDNNSSFIKELHQSGYATDPLYAEKVMRVLSGKEMRNALLRMF